MSAKERLVDCLLLQIDKVDNEDMAMALVVAMTKLLPRKKSKPYFRRLRKFRNHISQNSSQLKIHVFGSLIHASLEFGQKQQTLN